MLKKSDVGKLISSVLQMEEEEEAKASGNIGYMSRVLVQITMPHRNAKEMLFERKNGKLILTMVGNPKVGLPYGVYPRLLLAWMVTEAVQTQSPTITLGRSLSEFMSRLSLIPSGGRWGTIDRLKNQIKRLFNSSISLVYEDKYLDSGVGFNIVKGYRLWRGSMRHKHPDYWGSTVTLSKDFFDEITSKPVPIDMRALGLLKNSSVSIDLYCWLTYRMSYLSKKVEIPWVLLQKQFGSDYADTKQGKYEFKRKLKKQLKKVLIVYSQANVQEGKNGLILSPGPTHIKK